MLFGLAVVLYCLCVVGHYLVIEFDRTRAAERRELESKLLAQDAELRLLRTQVDPHFLFNSLNSISALTSIDPARARQMTVQLSEFFRRTLGLDAQRKVTVQEEARLVTDFLAIEQVRFGARLQSEVVVEEGALACLVPPMILQPLVENAVKHGIGGLPEGGTIRVHAKRDGSRLRVEVANDVDADAPTRKGNRMGLANVRQRLATVYAHDAALNWARENRTFRVELILPAETKGD
jgi:LytS/YehU family sensor histidine kinase